jgi:hypothetical protein
MRKWVNNEEKVKVFVFSNVNERIDNRQNGEQLQ